MDELIKSIDIQNYSLIGASLAAITAFLYKVTRIVKRDNKEDALDEHEINFRNMILEELKSCKESSNNLLLEKAELKAEIAKLKEQVTYLLSTLRKAGIDTISFRND